MAFFFSNHPRVSYDISKNNNFVKATNPLVRFKIQDIIKNTTAIYFKHTVEEGQSIQFIAQRYYGDSNLDWVIMITNDIYDILYDWPMDYQVFTEFVKSKYGSVETALKTVHQYEHIIQEQTVLSDETIIPEEFLVVDKTTYDGLGINEKREISKFGYEERENEKKRSIKILQRRFLQNILDEAESIFE